MGRVAHSSPLLCLVPRHGLQTGQTWGTYTCTWTCTYTCVALTDVPVQFRALLAPGFVFLHLYGHRGADSSAPCPFRISVRESGSPRSKWASEIRSHL